jgi:acetyltransferase-like isoleucine patch superfamily enzyme
MVTTRHGSWRTSRISAAPGSRIERDRSAALRLEGWLGLGFFPSPIGDLDILSPRQATLLRLRRSSTATLGEGVRLGSGVRCIVGQGARLAIGAGSFVTADSLILCGNRVTIGAHCAISWQVQIMDWDMHHLAESEPNSAPVTLGDHVWIGSRATILKGVTIGDGAVVGAGSVVARDIPAKTAVAGNPARVVREQVDWKL